MNKTMLDAFVDELQKISASSVSAKIEAAKKAGPGPDTGPPGKGKADPRFLENIGKGFKKAAGVSESKVTQLLASMKKEPKRKA
jgi:hypothetical protein